LISLQRRAHPPRRRISGSCCSRCWPIDLPLCSTKM
jgi:hypothetical protein